MPEFITTIHATGNNTGIAVPEVILDLLGGGKRPAVKVKAGDYTYRSTVGKMSGTFMIPLSAEHRENSGLAGGDEVLIELELDTEPRTVEVPADLAAALAESIAAAQAYDGLPPGKRKWLVKGILDAKKAETRQRRIVKAIADLESGKA